MKKYNHQSHINHLIKERTVMQTITKYLALLMLCLSVQFINAQDTIPAIKNRKNIEMLEKVKITIQNEEKEYLKKAVEAINGRLQKGEITEEEAKVLKKEAAEKAALNIQNRIAMVDNKIALFKRNDYGLNRHGDGKENRIGLMVSNRVFSVKGKKRVPKNDPRTSNDFVLSFGLNNAITKGQNLDDSPYKIGGSGFVELGWNWKTRVFKESRFLRFKYGFSFQWNKLNIKDNQYLVQNGKEIILEEFSESLRKAKFRTTQLVIPVYFEFGPMRKMDRKDDRIRYINNNQFKIGLGAYGGINIGTRQKLKYSVNGDNAKDKIRRSYNTSDFVYGLGAYIGFGDTSLYLKYDLSPIFKDQLVDQNNISLGLRFDID